jgi:predicted dehydrogenase
MILKPDQQQERELGRQNYQAALGITRRDFLATAAAGIPAGAFYFGYRRLEGNPVRAGIIGCGDEGQVLVTESNPDYLEFIAYSDIRPSNQKRAMEGENNNVRIGFKRKYGVEAAAKIAERSRDYHDDYRRLLDDPDIEMVVIALPLHLHAKVTIEAMERGKHVLCEKLMAQTVGDCKRMIEASEREQKLLAVGHQRHYSILYDNAVSLVKSGVLGDIRYIRALWHRNNTFPLMKKDADGKLLPVLDDQGRPMFIDGWRKPVPEEDRSIDYAKHGYRDVEELVRWRLFNTTSGGLMAELGSHQLDASGIFIARGVHGQEHAVHPIAVSGLGVKSFYSDEREADDHIFCTFEFPGLEYGKTLDREDVVIVTYSSINTNASENYGETVYGSRGTLMVELEKDVLLFKERDPNVPGSKPPTGTSITVSAKPGDKPVLDSSPSPGGATPQAAMAAATGQISRGYREEMEHFAYQVRRFSPGDYETLTNDLRCNGKVALADAVIALVANQAMKERRRIEFREAWFDPKSPEVPQQGEQLAKT